jgi:ParB family chromosome partitioning protein
MEALKESLAADPRMLEARPIIALPDGTVLCGNQRLHAARELGWTEIESTIKDVDDAEALILSIATNLSRSDMTEREQGKVLHQITQVTGWSQRDVAKKIGKSYQWVSKRIRVALDLHPDVADALEKGTITMAVAEIIASLEVSRQVTFLKYLLENKITDAEEARKAKRRFLNTTIYTVGYEGREIQEFVDLLKQNNIELLVDVRFSVESQFKPEFSKTFLQKELERAGIKYLHRPDLGVPFEWQNPYKDGAIPVECFEKYYRWHISTEVTDAKFIDFVDMIRETGKTVLMCYERYAKPSKTQKIACHRNVLANMMMEKLFFQERTDL